MAKSTLFVVAAFIATAFAQDAAPPVKIDLYYETLCPYSRAYFVDQLYPTYLQLKDVMDVALYPFGNADYEATADGGYTFTCQHGPAECRGNMIHACAQKYITDFDVEMDFVNCLLSAEFPSLSGETCATEVGVDYTPIGACVDSVEGQQALYEVALLQEQLDPALYFVPWILVDDTFSEDQVTECQTDQKAVVCDRYTGPAPDACLAKSSPVRNNQRTLRKSYGKH